MIRYGKKDCEHVWVYREEGYEEQCVAVICKECGAFGCGCDDDVPKHTGDKWDDFISNGLKAEANPNGNWVNPYVEKTAFLICPVRGVPQEETERYCKLLEDEGYKVHWPPRDTNQDDDVGLRICNDNLEAIKKASIVAIVWDGKSQGVLFDAGMAFSLGKTIKYLALPEKTTHKSFQNMFMAWGEKFSPKR